jgi:hypothetical protein
LHKFFSMGKFYNSWQPLVDCLTNVFYANTDQKTSKHQRDVQLSCILPLKPGSKGLVQVDRRSSDIDFLIVVSFLDISWRISSNMNVNVALVTRTFWYHCSSLNSAVTRSYQIAVLWCVHISRIRGGWIHDNTTFTRNNNSCRLLT